MPDMTIEAIHRTRREALRSDGATVPITKLLDGDGDETDDLEAAVYFVAGNDDL